MATVPAHFGSPPPPPPPRLLRRRATFTASSRRSAAAACRRNTSMRRLPRLGSWTAKAMSAADPSAGGGDASEIIVEVESSNPGASFLAKVAVALGVALTITAISIFLKQPTSGPSFSLPQIIDASTQSDTAVGTIGYTFSLFGKKVIIPEYTPGWVYFWLLMAAGFGLFVSEEALNVWVGISLARTLCLDGTWQSLANSFSTNASYIISTVLWVYWGVCLSDMVPFYLGKLFRQTKASEDIYSKLGVSKEKALSVSRAIQKYGNLIGFVERFSIGVRNPTSFLAGATGVSADCYFAGVCFGCLFTLPIQGTSYENMTMIVKDYVEGLINKYPYWNRTLGADHFFVTCHDVGVRAFEGLPFMVKNSIRAVCSPSYNVDFIPHKDIALPQVLQPFALPEGGNDIENRTNLGFWAGHRNSKIRVILARVWENDTELAINNNRINRAIGELVYQKKFYRTKFCICPGGSQVNSARISDSIHYGCVPVILSNYYDLPFNDVLNWRKFAVILKERDVYELKGILKSISHEEFVALHKSLVQVQKHFVWHSPPVPYDAFHMVMYELWLRHHVIKY